MILALGSECSQKDVRLGEWMGGLNRLMGGVVTSVVVLGIGAGCSALGIDPIEDPTDHSLRSTPADRAFPISPYFITAEFGGDLGFGFHLGDDIFANPGDPVLAAADGEVIVTKVNDVEGFGWGALVVIQHTLADGDFATLYGHLSTSRGLLVETGQEVVKGDMIGFIASSSENGVPGGPHLHFGVRPGNGVDDMVCGAWLWLGVSTTCEGMTHQQYRRLWEEPVDFLIGR